MTIELGGCRFSTGGRVFTSPRGEGRVGVKISLDIGTFTSLVITHSARELDGANTSSGLGTRNEMDWSPFNLV